MTGTDIVIVWIQADEHAAHDLKYALRSLEQHWMGNFRVTIVGDKPPGLQRFYHLPHQRMAATEHPKALDAVRKLEAIVAAPHIQQRFVYAYDDTYLLRPVDELYLAKRRAVREVPDTWTVGDAGKVHKVALFNTVQCLRDHGFKRIWDYETHMPRVFEKRKLQEVMDLYKPAERRLLVPTLYFNHHYRHQEPELLSPLDDCKVVFYGRHSKDSVPPAPTTDSAAAIAYYAKHCVGKHLWNHNNNGMRDVNLQYLRHSIWPDASAFEIPATQPTTT